VSLSGIRLLLQLVSPGFIALLPRLQFGGFVQQPNSAGTTMELFYTPVAKILLLYNSSLHCAG
jgi:hypothetical protein